MSDAKKEILKDITDSVKKMDENQMNYIAGYVSGLADAKKEKKDKE